MNALKCQYAGCKKPAEFILTGPVNRLVCCASCAPAWVRDGKPSAFEAATGIKSYKVERIERESKTHLAVVKPDGSLILLCDHKRAHGIAGHFGYTVRRATVKEVERVLSESSKQTTNN